MAAAIWSWTAPTRPSAESKLAVASGEGVVTYALSNDVWREEGRVGADADALGDDEARSPHSGAGSTTREFY